MLSGGRLQAGECPSVDGQRKSRHLDRTALRTTATRRTAAIQANPCGIGGLAEWRFRQPAVLMLLQQGMSSRTELGCEIAVFGGVKRAQLELDD